MSEAIPLQLKQQATKRNGRRTRRKIVMVVVSAILLMCYLAENIGWLVSINGDIAIQNSPQRQFHTPVSVGSASAFCLLIKDDNDILSEWVAYHYHVFSMRRLIVAVDPDSKQNPRDVLQPYFKLNLNFTVWQDSDYTPNYFHNPNALDYSKLPNSVRQSVELVNKSSTKKNSAQLLEPILKTDWHKDKTYVRKHQEEVRQQILKINSHRFRQKNFVSECFRRVRLEEDGGISWVVHIDTDEYLVPNPWIASYVYNASNANENRRDELGAILPEKPSDGSLWSFFSKFMESASRRGCVMMPRILFGGKEDKKHVKNTTATVESNNGNQTTKYTWNHRNFESLRWQYHSDFESNSRPKSMVNVQMLHNREPIFETKLARSIHRPMGQTLKSGKPGCSAEPLRINNRNNDQQPLAVYHYLGSLKRYMARKDARRDPSIYKRNNNKSNFARGDENLSSANTTTTATNAATTRWWMGEWLEDFVETHGPETAYAVLGESYGTRE